MAGVSPIYISGSPIENRTIDLGDKVSLVLRTGERVTVEVLAVTGGKFIGKIVNAEIDLSAPGSALIANQEVEFIEQHIIARSRA